jgi:hypothetical protein
MPARNCDLTLPGEETPQTYFFVDPVDFSSMFYYLDTNQFRQQIPRVREVTSRRAGDANGESLAECNEHRPASNLCEVPI